MTPLKLLGAGERAETAQSRAVKAAWIGLLGSLWLPALGLMGTHLALRLPGHRKVSSFARRCSRRLRRRLTIASLNSKVFGPKY